MGAAPNTQVSDGRYGDSFPAWPPNSQMLAFTSNRAIGVEVYLMAANGSGLRRITNALGINTQPSWSRDGKLAFVSNRDGNFELYVTRP